MRNDVLVVGAGGLGCEMLRCLAQMGFHSLHVLDFDKIELSNLNRQFLYSERDVGKFKADVAAKFLMKRVPNLKVTAHLCAVEDKNPQFYSQFGIVMCGLDNIESRRWVNSAIFETVPCKALLIDGGSEGLMGHSRVIIPHSNACYECTMGIQSTSKQYPVCTLKGSPKIPAHCVHNSLFLKWPRRYPDTEFDPNNQEHIDLIFKMSLEVAKEFKISGINKAVVEAIAKNTTPVLASTNAVVAAHCCAMAFKVMKCREKPEFNYLMYNAQDGVYLGRFNLNKVEECSLCGNKIELLTVDPQISLQELIDIILEKHKWIQISQMSIRTLNKSLYVTAIPFLEQETRKNLPKNISSLIHTGNIIVISVKNSSHAINIKIIFNKGSVCSNAQS